MRAEEPRARDHDDGLRRVEHLAPPLGEGGAQPVRASKIGIQRHEVGSAHDHVLRREVTDEAEVPWGEPEVERAAAEERLSQRCRSPLARGAARRRHRRRYDGGDLGIGEERDCVREPVPRRRRAVLEEGDDLALRVAACVEALLGPTAPGGTMSSSG
jgi:hypothetical protein